MATIRRVEAPRSGLCWEAQVRIQGYPRASRRFRLRKDAERWAAEEERLIRLGKAATAVLVFDDLVSVYKASPAWLELSGKTRAAALIAYWQVAFRGIPVAKITSALVAQHRDQLKASGKAPSTCNHFLSALSVVYKSAQERYEVTNPARIRRYKPRNERTRYLSDSEFDALMDGARSVGHPYLVALILAALSSGAREGELMSLEWQRLSVERGTATLLAERAKAGEFRTLRFRGPALDALAALPRAGPFVFSRDGSRPHWPRTAWAKALRAAELADFRFHDLRHTSGTWLAMQGAGGPEVQMHLGHTTLLLTSRYVHLAAGQQSLVGPLLVPRYF